ncbi:hypothetical protein BGZ99_006650 [Dissophora globulifera]|uniref:Uncharacterized protein n=1 Tax=Dissophora globulifera TaxID=979702 RepID=A0A9P6US43_9FUNG|nr:hypothetical protein BGZ99_006650 [Dissophora globulifera]
MSDLFSKYQDLMIMSRRQNGNHDDSDMESENNNESLFLNEDDDDGFDLTYALYDGEEGALDFDDSDNDNEEGKGEEEVFVGGDIEADIDYASDEQDGIAHGRDQELVLSKEVEVMPWLEEAIQTVSVLEARLVELEEDCKSIPLYEQDREQMIQVIQELDSIVQQDQGWIESAESAIQWTAFALEEALLSSSHTTSLSALASRSQRSTRSYCLSSETGRKSNSEGMLPSLVATSTAVTTRDGCSDTLIPKATLLEDRADNLVNEVADAVPAAMSSRIQQQWGLMIDSSQQQQPEVVYRNAIMTALRHLKNIEESQTVVMGIEATRSRPGSETRRKSEKRPAPDAALKEWLENASMMSLASEQYHTINDANEDIEDDEEVVLLDTDSIDNVGDEDAGDRESCVANYADGGGRRIESRVSLRRDSVSESASPHVATRLSASEPRLSNHCGGADTSATRPRTDASVSPFPNSSSTSVDSSVSAASFHATISGSSQSLKTDLGGCLMDERIFLKQHIQALDRLRHQEHARHQRAEQVHQQLILDLTRFSKELVQSVNNLTCAQADLDEAGELTLMTLQSFETASMTENGTASDDADIIKGKRMIQASVEGLTTSMRMVEQGIKHMRTLAADCVGITELARDHCSTITPTQLPDTETERLMHDNTETDLVTDATTTRVPLTIITRTDLLQSATPEPKPRSPHNGIPLTPATATTLQTLAGTGTPVSVVASTSALSPLPSTFGQPPSSIFVDGVAFQEFEAHLVSLRTSPDSISKKLLSKRMTNKRSAAANTTLTQQQHQLDVTTPFMKRVLMEDIYPCLLIHPRAPPLPTTKQGSWISNLLSPSSSSPSSLGFKSGPSTYALNPQTPWLQRLLEAIEKSACEIEFWKTNRHGLYDSASTPTPGPTLSATTTASFAMQLPPNVSCCLCGIVRPCEFRLRLVESGSLDNASTSTAAAQSHPSPTSKQQHHHPLDRFCRDRIVAVCDFYMFLAHLRQGLLRQQSIPELFRRALWLRQRMACARIGSMDVMQVSLRTPLV